MTMIKNTEKLRSKSVTLHKRPVSAQIYLTYKCTSKCRSCTFWQKKCEELPLDKVRTVIDKLVDFGVTIITLTGGDIFLRKDFKEIFEYLKSKKVSIILCANGIIFPDSIIEMINQYGRCYVLFSLDTLDKKKYKYLRGVDQLDRVISNILKFKVKARNLPRMFMTVSKVNYEEILPILNFCKKNRLSVTFCPYISAEDAVWVTDDPELKFDKSIRHKISEEYHKLAKLSKTERSLFGFSEYYNFCAKVCQGETAGPCGAGYDVITITPNGGVSACLNLPEIGNIFNESLEEIYSKDWQSQVKKCYSTLPCAMSCTHQILLARKYPLKFIAESIRSGRFIDYIGFLK